MYLCVLLHAPWLAHVLVLPWSALQDQLDKAKQDTEAAQQNAEAVKAQAKGLEREYDRLLAEHDALQRSVARGGGGGYAGAGKKAD
jgi:F0F1-type ATP synthase membrane subunit b/b'